MYQSSVGWTVEGQPEGQGSYFFLLGSGGSQRQSQTDPADKATAPPGWTGRGRDKGLPVREADPMLESD